MSRLLILGGCPLPGENDRPASREGTCAWTLIRPLREAGHDVRFMALRDENDYRHPVPPAVRHRREDGFCYEALNAEFFSDAKLLVVRQDDWRPDAVIGAGSIPAARMAVLSAEAAQCPAWVDLPQDLLAEIRSNVEIGLAIQTILARADRVSVASREREDVVLGQLGLVGRLNRHMVGETFTCVIPAAEKSTDLSESPSGGCGAGIEELLRWAGAPSFAADRAAIGRTVPLNSLHASFF